MFQTFRSPVEDCDGARDFHQSELVEPKRKLISRVRASDHEEDVRGNVADMHVVMFQTLHNSNLVLDDIAKFTMPEIVNLCALSEYYGCFVPIRDAVNIALWNEPSVLQEIKDEPVSYLRLAVKLEHDGMYVAAYRQIVSRSLRDNPQLGPWEWSDARFLADHLGLCREEYFYKHANTLIALRKGLRSFTLSKRAAEYCGEENPVHISETKMLKEARPGHATASSSLARTLFAEWLTSQELGDKTLTQSGRMSGEAAWLSDTMAQITISSKAKKPGTLTRRHVIVDFVSSIGEGWSIDPIEEVYEELGKIVLEANEQIERAFAQPKDLPASIFCRSKVDRGIDDGFNHLGLHDGDLPWEWESPEEFWENVLDPDEDEGRG